jgi:ketosteroid isomerase-like protein
MRLARRLGVALVVVVGSSACFAQSDADRAAVEKTGAAIRAAFAAGDVAAAMRYHHPEVRKALAYDKVLVGREAVAANLRETLAKFHLEFVRNDVESLLIVGDTAVEQTLFTIRVSAAGAPAGDPAGASYEFKGRTMVVYVRYAESPTGWASIRELIQPAPGE